MSDKMREEFEAEVLNGNLLPCNSVSKLNGGNEYLSPLTVVAWRSWQASRAALCVELPSKTNDESDERSIWYDHAINEAQDALDAAGVRYK